MKSTSSRYGTAAVTLHWRSAVLILALIGTGFRVASLSDTTVKAALLRLHVPLGLAILGLTLLRIGWWAFADRKPDPLPNQSRSQRIAASAVHGLFYVVLPTANRSHSTPPAGTKEELRTRPVRSDEREHLSSDRRRQTSRSFS